VSPPDRAGAGRRRTSGLRARRGAAIAGIVAAALGTLLFVGWVAFFGVTMLRAWTVAPPTTAAAPGDPPPFASETAPPGGWRRIHAVEIHAGGGPLRAQLSDEVRSAKSDGELVLVQTIAPSCDACSEILRAMSEPSVQRVLSGVRLVRVDAHELPSELAALHMSEPNAPWFYLLDARGEPVDAISAEEWDDNTPGAIAPVLDAFVRGRLRSRRVAWRGITSL
jgi:hypothetical protein